MTPENITKCLDMLEVKTRYTGHFWDGKNARFFVGMIRGWSDEAGMQAVRELCGRELGSEDDLTVMLPRAYRSAKAAAGTPEIKPTPAEARQPEGIPCPEDVKEFIRTSVKSIAGGMSMERFDGRGGTSPRTLTDEEIAERRAREERARRQRLEDFKRRQAQGDPAAQVPMGRMVGE